MTRAQLMALHEELNSMLRQGQRECLHLNGSIRKLKSGQAMLMMKKDKAKKELEVYVNKMSESLIDFKSEMHVSIQTELDAKVQEITSLREKYEAHIHSYMELCDETEKLVQFGRIKAFQADILKARQLLNEFSHLQEATSEKFEIDTLMKLEFYPALPVDCISSSMFGDLIRGGSSRQVKSSLSALSARKNKTAQDQTTQAYGEEDFLRVDHEKIDRCTQTDSIKEPTIKSPSGVADNRGRASDTSVFSCTQYDNQQYLPYPISPPGYEYVTLPYCAYDSCTQSNPPPGFSVFQQPGSPMQSCQPDQLQMNSCLLTGVPIYHSASQFNNSYAALTAPPVTYPLQNIPLYTCNRPVSTEQTFSYQPGLHYTPSARKSHAVPVTHPTTGSVTSDARIEKSEKDRVKNVCKSENGPDVKNIPLPIGPAPKESIASRLSNKHAAEKPLSMQDESMADAKQNRIVPGLTRVKQEKIENKETRSDYDTGDKTPIKMETFEKLLQKTTELLGSNTIDEKSETKRFDEASETVSEMWYVENKSKLSTKEKSPVNKMEIDQMLSHIGHDLKEKITKGEEIIFPIKPLRRPLRLPRSVCPEPKTEADSEPVLADPKPVLADPKPVLADPKPVLADPKPVLADPEHVLADLKPVLADLKPVLADLKPMLADPKPVLADPKPVLADPEHVLADLKPVLADLKPMLAEPEPVSADPQVNEQPVERQVDHKLKCVVEAVENKTEDVVIKKTESSDSPSIGPDILDVSSSSGMTLRDAVKGYGLSKRELSEKNKQTLQKQTSWLKGYLKQMLPNREKESNVEICDENNNNLNESTQLEKKENVISESAVANAQSKILQDSPKLRFKEKYNNRENFESVTSVDVAETVSSEKVETKYVSSENITEKLSDISDSLNKTDSQEKSPEIKKENRGICSDSSQGSTKTDREPNKTIEVPEGKATIDVPEKKADLKNLKSTVKSFLGDKREGKQRSMSTYSRLGALQAHWLKHAGTNIKAQLQFQCSHNMHFPIGVTSNSLQYIIVADTGNNCVKMFDQDGLFVRDIQGHGMCRPSAVVVNEFDHIFVKDDVSIRVFDNRGDYITDIAKDLIKPFGLVLTPAKCLLVLETNRRKPALVHISQDGKNIWKFAYQPLMNASIGSKCRFMGVSDNNVIVSDLGLSQIYITNFEGIFLKWLGSHGTGIGMFVEPSGIAVDNYGNIVIGDSKNNRLQVYRHDGSYTGLVSFDDKIVRPSGIHLTSDNRLFVVNFLQHVVKVYQLQA